jgi:hypothetical protein
MFLRSNNRKKDGKDHRYFSIVENHRIASDKTVQRTVLYLGEAGLLPFVFAIFAYKTTGPFGLPEIRPSRSTNEDLES